MLKSKLSYVILSLVLCTMPIVASFLLVEDFEAYVAGSAIDGQGDWTSLNVSNQVVADPVNASNNVLLLGSGVERNATYNDNASLDTPDGSVATLFTRFRMASGSLNVNFGLSDLITPDLAGTYDHFEAQVRAMDGVMDTRDSSGFQRLSSGGGNAVNNTDVWYELWMVANNATDTVTLFIQSDEDPVFLTQTELFSAAPPTGFRFGTVDSLKSIYLVNNASDANFYFDDFWIDTTGENLLNPTVPSGPVVVVDDSIEVVVNGALAFDPTANDTGGTNFDSLEIVTSPAFGTVSIDLDRRLVVYKHTGDSAGADSFRYRISNFAEDSTEEANVSISVTGELRVENNTVAIPLDPPSGEVGQLAVKNALPGLNFPDAVAMTTVPGSPNALMVASIKGSIWYVPDTTAAVPTRHEILNVTPLSNFTNGRSIFSVTCYPDFETTGNIVVNYQGDGARLPVPGAGQTILDVIPNLDLNGQPSASYNTDLRVSRFTLSAAHIADVVANGMSAAENQAALNTEFPFINMAEQNSIHTIGDCKFGPDGYLYVSFGDEGGQPDVHRNGQRINKDYFSSLLRIDVDPDSTNPKPNPHYTIPAGPLDGGVYPFFTDAENQTPNFRVPADNPFIHTSLGGTWGGDFNGADLSGALDSIRTEIWALGLRNPFKFHMDQEDGTGDTEAWIGDVGYETWEEFNRFEKGDNGGWSYYEDGIRTPGVTHASMPSGETPHTRALWSYTTNGPTGDSATGGIFYRSATLSSLTGSYVCGDYGSGRIFSITREGVSTELTSIRMGGNDIVDFELDAATGEIFMLEHGPSGRVMRIMEESNPPVGYPLTLSETGVFADLTDLSPNPGVLPYKINLRFWSDDADKYRWFTIPNLTDTIGYSENDPWTFPEGMVWVKHFDFDLDRANPGTSIQRLETRLLVRNATGSYGVSYRWRVDGSEADLAANPGEEFVINFTDAEGQSDSFTWQIPSRAECLTCHSAEAGHALSSNTRQLNFTQTLHGQTGNMLELLNDAGYLDGFEADPDQLPRHYRPDESEIDLEARVRSYLDVNCAYCHFPGGGTPQSWDGRAFLSTPLTHMLYGNQIGDGAPNETDSIVRPGNKAESAIWNKINARTAINGTFNSHTQMPPLASNRLDAEGISLIAEWIDNYANVAPALPVPLAPVDTTDDVDVDTLLATVVATDPDVRAGQADQSQLTYSITSGNGEALFALDPVTGEVTVASALDFAQANQHVFELTVSDNFSPNPLNSTASLTVNVEDAIDIDGNRNGVPDAWEELFGISGAPVGNDEDKDGLPDFFEWVMGQNPVSPISHSVIALNPLAQGGTTYSWRYSDPFVLGLDYLLQGSGSMSAWQELGEGVDFEIVSDTADGDGYRRLTIRLIGPPMPSYFLRLSNP